jgi:hypothetical protein
MTGTQLKLVVTADISVDSLRFSKI